MEVGEAARSETYGMRLAELVGGGDDVFSLPLRRRRSKKNSTAQRMRRLTPPPTTPPTIAPTCVFGECEGEGEGEGVELELELEDPLVSGGEVVDPLELLKKRQFVEPSQHENEYSTLFITE